MFWTINLINFSLYLLKLKKIFIASDHAGYDLKNSIITKLKKIDPKCKYTYFHNSFFNPSLNENIEILNFSPIKTGIKIID